LVQELSFCSRYLVSESFPFFLRSVVVLICALIILANDLAWLSIITLAWAAVLIPVSYATARRSVHGISDALSSAAAVSAATVEIVQNHELIPTFGSEQAETERYNRLLEKERICFSKTQASIDRTDFLQRLLQTALPVAMALMLIFSGQIAQMTPGLVASIFSLMLILTTQIGDFGRGVLAAMEIRQRMTVALQKLACPPEKEATASPVIGIEPATWDITFSGVSFGYCDDRLALQDIDLEIKERERIGIAGHSGSGKTTLIRLLKGAYRPKTGQVCIGGHALHEIGQKAIAQNIAEVSQTAPIFHRSIRENVAYGYPTASDEQIWEVLARAQIADYVAKLPKGLDTVVGVAGQKLSGGERARIAIARALIRQSRIIIFDEAMASIDSESEALVRKGLEELMDGRTVITIAHRLSTLQSMDKLIVLEHGQIVGQGMHDTLLKDNPAYQRLWCAATQVTG
jgi:ABC-type multidrug transport system fused ATPase/permease subunit